MRINFAVKECCLNTNIALEKAATRQHQKQTNSTELKQEETANENCQQHHVTPSKQVM
jgi:hypothetical protein